MTGPAVATSGSMGTTTTGGTQEKPAKGESGGKISGGGGDAQQGEEPVEFDPLTWPPDHTGFEL